MPTYIAGKQVYTRDVADTPQQSGGGSDPYANASATLPDSSGGSSGSGGAPSASQLGDVIPLNQQLPTNGASAPIGTVATAATLHSPNYQSGGVGWIIKENGDVEFNNGTFNGTITATTGTIGGWTIGTTTLSSGNVTIDSANEQLRFGSASSPTVGTGIFLGKSGSAYDFRVGDPAGTQFYWDGSNMLINGGKINGVATGTDIALLGASHNLTFTATDASTVTWSSGTITLSNGVVYSISSGTTGTMAAKTYIYLDPVTSTTVLQISTTASTSSGANKMLLAVAQNGTGQATFQVYGGAGGLKIGSSQMNLANNNWTFSGAFSVTDADTVAWGSGTLTTSDGTSYSISGGNTGNMAAKTYVYFDISISSTAFQSTTTASTSVGDGKILIAVAQNNTTEATFQVFGGGGGVNIDAASIVAGSITANEISAGAVTATKINVSQLSAISADMGAITAGTIIIPSGGYIRSGQTDYNVGSGFWLGNVSTTPKFSIGNPAARYLTWDGSDLTINGYVQSTTGSFGGDGSDGALTISSGTTTIDCANANILIKNYTSISITGTAQLAFINPATNGTIVVLKSQGNVTITSSATPAIELSGMGATSGTNGVFQNTNSYGDSGIYATSTAASGGSAMQPIYNVALHYAALKRVLVVPGSGGGNGDTTGHNAAGGRGGGGLYIECKGAFNGTSTVYLRGLIGADGDANGAAGGGGGAGGVCVILYNTLTANSLTIDNAGGNGGGTPGPGTDTNSRGGGGAGGITGAGGGSFASGGVGAGGGGANGGAASAGASGGAAAGGIVAQNTAFA